MPFLRKRPKRLYKKPKALYLEGQFSRLGSKDFALQPDEISNIEGLKELKSGLPDDIPLEVSLNSSLPILDLDETGFAEVSDRHDPTCQGEGFLNQFQFFVREGTEGLVKVSGGVGCPEIVGVGIDPILS